MKIGSVLTPGGAADINQRLYSCNMCNSQFTRSDLLSRHKKTCGNSLNPHRSRQKSCQACAESKIKCDLLYPCSKCTSRGRTCIFFNDPEISRMKKCMMKSLGGSAATTPQSEDLDLPESPPLTPNSYYPHASSLKTHENSDCSPLRLEQRTYSIYPADEFANAGLQNDNPDTQSLSHGWYRIDSSHSYSVSSFDTPSPTQQGRGSAGEVSYYASASESSFSPTGHINHHGSYGSPGSVSSGPSEQDVAVMEYTRPPSTQYPQYHHHLATPAPVTGSIPGYGLDTATYSYPQLAEQPTYKPWFRDDLSSNTTSSLPSPDSPYGPTTYV
uniref:Zn(2)-C6 fungal-type domain-containing protein n=1 Tax=Moniliophthora roreri TaxID=221103 RepID=A0A0W0EY96_MONRR